MSIDNRERATAGRVIIGLAALGVGFGLRLFLDDHSGAVAALALLSRRLLDGRITEIVVLGRTRKGGLLLGQRCSDRILSECGLRAFCRDRRRIWGSLRGSSRYKHAWEAVRELVAEPDEEAGIFSLLCEKVCLHGVTREDERLTPKTEDGVLEELDSIAILRCIDAKVDFGFLRVIVGKTDVIAAIAGVQRRDDTRALGRKQSSDLLERNISLNHSKINNKKVLPLRR